MFEDDDSAGTASRLKTMRLPLWVTIVVAALLIAALIMQAVWQRQSARQQEAAVQAVTQQLDAERAAIRSGAADAVLRHSDHVHRLFGTALAWAIRDALIRNNHDLIDQYFSELVKDERIRLVLLADTAGKIVLATDRNLKGARLEQHFPAALLQQTGVAIHPGEGLQRRLVVPIHGLSSRLGTALLVYDLPAPAQG